MSSALPLPSCRIYCFCAQWCRTCVEYLQVFEALQKEYLQHDWIWIDIEKNDACMQEVEVEVFPTVLISAHDQIYFWGEVLPQYEVLSTLVRRLSADDISSALLPSIVQLNVRLNQLYH